jgi:hypothetical protein
MHICIKVTLAAKSCALLEGLLTELFHKVPNAYW